MTAIPALERKAMAAVTEALGSDVRALVPTAGGCIARAWRADLRDGRRVFLKTLPGAPADMFPREAEGLRALAAPGILRTPAVIAVAAEYLALEWIEPGPRTREAMARFGEALAAHHRATATPGGHGFGHDNYIGATPQANGPMADWVAFWRERRLRPQLELAAAHGRLDRDTLRRGERLLARLGEWLDPGEPACLLHGDLWSGNLHAAREGPAAVIDPAAYRGGREAELAMMRLFGGFEGPCLDAYRAAWPLAPGHEERLPVYTLYHLLNHVNLGQGYEGSTAATLRRLVG